MAELALVRIAAGFVVAVVLPVGMIVELVAAVASVELVVAVDEVAAPAVEVELAAVFDTVVIGDFVAESQSAVEGMLVLG